MGRDARLLRMGLLAAGEMAGADDVRSAVEEMHADRIGHGYSATHDASLLAMLRARQTHLEACPGNHPQNLADVGAFERAGLRFGLNTDDPASYFGNVSLLGNEMIVRRALGFTDATIAACYADARAAAFAPHARRVVAAGRDGDAAARYEGAGVAAAAPALEGDGFAPRPSTQSHATKRFGSQGPVHEAAALRDHELADHELAEHVKTPYRIDYFDQRTDHFRSGADAARRWRQRYLIDDRHWKLGGPILFYTGVRLRALRLRAQPLPPSHRHTPRPPQKAFRHGGVACAPVRALPARMLTPSGHVSAQGAPPQCAPPSGAAWHVRCGPQNEGPITAFYSACGFLTDVLAPRLGALLLFAEARFYGSSLPFGRNGSFTPQALALLSTEQILADYAALLAALQGSLNATSSAVVAFGGSYGGTLATFFRLKYPHLTVGALAASAPIGYYSPSFWAARHVDGLTWFRTVERVYTEAAPGCYAQLVHTVALARARAASADPAVGAKLAAAFGLCSAPTDVDAFAYWITEALESIPQACDPARSRTSRAQGLHPP